MPTWPPSSTRHDYSLSVPMAGNLQPPPHSAPQPTQAPINRKPVPRTPQPLITAQLSPNRAPFAQQNAQPVPSSPTRPSTSGGERHYHSRSMSNPLPKLFGRKRSNPGLRVAPSELPPDGVLVPVLESPGAANTSAKLIAGKKDDDRDMVTRQCMCCDSKVRFPRGLVVFRCTNCMTINDLEPYRPRPKLREADGRHPERRSNNNIPRQHTPGGQGRAEGNPPPQSAASRTLPAPLSLERSKSIIRRCLLDYLEARCRRPLRPHNPTCHDPFVNGEPLTTNPPAASSQSPDSPVRLASATITDPTDFDWLPPEPVLTSSPHRPSPTTGHSGPVPTMNSSPSAALGSQAPGRRPPPLPSKQDHPNGANAALPPGPGAAQGYHDRVKVIFKPFEDYMLATYGDYECLNSSFSTLRPHMSTRARSEETVARTTPPDSTDPPLPGQIDSLDHLDAKTLMIGDFAENGNWWTGPVARRPSTKANGNVEERKRMTTSKTANVNWAELDAFYELVHTAGARWWESLDHLDGVDDASVQQNLKGPRNAHEISNDLMEARRHAERALLKMTEGLLKRPTRQLQDPDHVRFLILILMNPSLYPENTKLRARAASSAQPGFTQGSSFTLRPSPSAEGSKPAPNKRPSANPASPQHSRVAEQHNGIRKRILGLIAQSSDTCHRYLIAWFSRFPEARFMELIDLVASFVTYRLLKRKPRARSHSLLVDGGLIPDLSGSARNTSAQLRSATGLGGSVRVKDMETTQSIVEYSEDWQLRAAAKVMALLFAANNSWQSGKAGLTPAETTMTSLSRPRAKTHGQLLPTSDFYNTLLDYNDLVADFKAWEQKKGKFTFCQFPFFLSVGAKIKVLEYDARRQMELKAREAYFDSVTKNRAIDGYLHLRVRRECMVADSLQQISAAVGQGQEELKKGLKVQFADEEGIDAGGLRKEWFLMIVRDIFDPNHGMFLYDDDSQTCYFNPNSFETSDQYYLVGALLGLAIYNSTILDIALPPFAFRKLLAAAPASSSNPSLPSTSARAQMTYTVDDLAEYRPVLAAGLRQLLEFPGDVQETFCRDFVAPIERYGVVTEVPLCAGGERKAVTNANRQEFVDLYVRYLLDVSVARQFEPFKRGFFTVCAGNALSLFRPEEIELLIRGSDEALDVDSLRAVAVYENWRSDSPPHKLLPNPADTVPVIGWFWDFFKKASPENQRLILSFVTGSDRIPAVGATNLVLKISCGGDGTGRGDVRGSNGVVDRDRFPIARTCFNMLVLWGYESREKLEDRLWRAVCESEGFGLK